MTGLDLSLEQDLSSAFEPCLNFIIGPRWLVRSPAEKVKKHYQ